ncbi:MAG: hypothetical protein QM756_43035 [Polyangiaceae bacterium]
MKTWLLLALVAGCARGEAPAHPSPAMSANATAKAAPSTPAPPVASAVPPAAPAEPAKPSVSVSVAELTRGFGPQQSRTLDALRSVCAAALKRDGERVRLGCVSCPPFDANARAAEVAVDPEEFYEAKAAYFGSFSDANAREAALVFDGCEPAAANYGGTLLMSFDGSTWTPKTYASGFHPEECRTFTRPDRRDILVCRWLSVHQLYGESGVGSYDFTRYDGKDAFSAWEGLIALQDNSYSACLDEPQTKRSLVADSVAMLEVDAARSQMSVAVRSFHGPKTSAYLAKCEELAKVTEDGPPVDVGAALRFDVHHLNFTWQAKGFTPDTATRALIRRVWKPR